MKSKAIRQAAIHLKKGRIGIFPTETVYGLAANALNPTAVLKIYECKKRPHFNPLIVHIHHIRQLNSLVKEISPEAKRLINAFWPGPLTLIFEKTELVPDIVSAGLPTIGVRMPNHPVAKALLQETGVPIAAPSANFFQTLSPTRFEDLDERLVEKVDFALEGGASKVGLESTILQLHPKIQILRAGGISKEQIEKVLKKKISYSRSKKITSPGQLKKHYSPNTPLFLRNTPPSPKKGVGILNLKTLSLKKAAFELFSRLKALDKMGLKKIIAIRVKNEGLGIAINDRLKRAANKN